MVVALCRYLLRDEHEADDAAQQAFLSAFRSLKAGTRPRHSAAWLSKIARNECLSRIQQRMREPLPVAAESDHPLDDPAESADQRETLQRLMSGVAALPERQREAVILRYFHGLSYREVAGALGVTVPVVESLLFRARVQLARRLGKVPRLTFGVLAVPVALRDEIARHVPGFEAAVGTGAAAGLGAGGIGGVLAKVASMSATAKIATATTVTAVAVGGAAAPTLVDGGSSRSASEPPAAAVEDDVAGDQSALVPRPRRETSAQQGAAGGRDDGATHAVTPNVVATHPGAQPPLGQGPHEAAATPAWWASGAAGGEIPGDGPAPRAPGFGTPADDAGEEDGIDDDPEAGDEQEDADAGEDEDEQEDAEAPEAEDEQEAPEADHAEEEGKRAGVEPLRARLKGGAGTQATGPAPGDEPRRSGGSEEPDEDGDEARPSPPSPAVALEPRADDEGEHEGEGSGDD